MIPRDHEGQRALPRAGSGERWPDIDLSGATVKQHLAHGRGLNPDQLAREERIDEAAVDVGGAWEMGRVGAAGDNTAMESFAALLEKSVQGRRTGATREAATTW